MPDSPPSEPPSETRLGSRPRTYLVAKNDRIDPLSTGPLEFDWLLEQLEADPKVQVKQRLRPRDFTLQRTGESMLADVVVATMPPETAAAIEKHPQVVLEEDQLVLPLPTPAPPVPDVAPLLFSPFGTAGEWQVELRTPTGAPVQGATVYLYGSGIPAQGRTDDNGHVTLSLLNEADDTLRSLYVNPQREVWSLWVDQPALISGVVNTITMPSLGEFFPGFPRTQLLGWGQVAMGLDQVPGTLDGRGVKVAVIDSGAAALTHPDLRAIAHGIDVTTDPPGATQWTVDTIAHGSHCSGIIAGSATAGGVRGFAPAAEVHEARIFPGGRVSSLLEAIDYCIAQQVDVVNMSLGTGRTSQIVLQKLAQARERGVACIVAAGNSGDAVQFPGSSPDVLTVAAIGRDGEFPDSSYHAQQRWTGGRRDRGYFAAQFSCHGPEIDVCAPGVAIVSSVPDSDYAAWDGTSMATPHVAGLAALVLAHHPDFRTSTLSQPTAVRVDRLFEILKSTAEPMSFGDTMRAGAGLPNAVRALGLEDAEGPPVGAGAQLAASRATLERLHQELIAANLLAVEPMSVGAAVVTPSSSSNQDGVPLTREQYRQLAMLQAQFEAAGLGRRDESEPSALLMDS